MGFEWTAQGSWVLDRNLSFGQSTRLALFLAVGCRRRYVYCVQYFEEFFFSFGGSCVCTAAHIYFPDEHCSRDCVFRQ